MFVKPVDIIKTPDKKAWENCTLHADGKYYAFFGTGRKTRDNPQAWPIGLDVYQSLDGVHWEVVAEDVLAIEGAHAGFGIHKIGDFFYYYPTCSTKDKSVHFKVYRTKDFIDWTHLGDEFDVTPDRTMYQERWDELYVMPDVDETGKDVLYGYISSETREDVGAPGAGMLRSYDGIRWEVLPPIMVVWGDIPSQHMELNFVEKVEGRYYLSMSGRAYMDSYGYSLYTFVGDTPYGPFAPDAEMFRLSGTCRRELTWLGHTIRTPHGLLVALWLSHGKQDLPSQTFAIGSLKRLACEKGHLRLRYWEGTDRAKGTMLALNLQSIHLAHPHPLVRTERDCILSIDQNNGEIQLSASRDGMIAMLDVCFDRVRGFILEGTLCARESRQSIATHHQSVGAGFFFEERIGLGIAMVADSMGVTRTGTLRYADHQITEKDEYANATNSLIVSRSGKLQGTMEFTHEDTVGPFGHAAMCGIRHAKTHSFRMLARGDYFELFIDDLYVQTYLLPKNMTGRVGLCVFDGSCHFSTLCAWEMSFS